MPVLPVLTYPSRAGVERELPFIVGRLAGFGTKAELYKDLVRAPRFDQSYFFKRLHDNLYGAVPVTPFTLLVGDFEFSQSPRDVELLDRLSHVAAAAHTAIIARASLTMFQADTWDEFARRRTPERLFQAAEYAKWRSFRQSEDARYIVLTVPPSSPEHLPLDGEVPDLYATLGFARTYPAAVSGEPLPVTLALARLAQTVKAMAAEHSDAELHQWFNRQIGGPLLSGHMEIEGNRAIIRALPATPAFRHMTYSPRVIVTLPR